jgi:hypothetical protein
MGRQAHFRFRIRRLTTNGVYFSLFEIGRMTENGQVDAQIPSVTLALKAA